MTTKLSLLLLGFFLVHPAFALAGVNDILGVWLTQDKDAKIEIYRCAAKYCGKIVWLAEPVYPAGSKEGVPGTPILDTKNPDTVVRNKPLVGKEILYDFQYVGDDAWKDGSIYDPDDGKTYRGSMQVLSRHKMEVRGFIGFSVFGSSTIWTK